jgi:hypothetical protein
VAHGQDGGGQPTPFWRRGWLKEKMGVAEATLAPIWPRGGLATPIWPRGGSATPKGQSEKKEKKEKRRGLSLAIENMAERVQQIKEDVCLNLEQANDKYNAAANKKQ